MYLHVGNGRTIRCRDIIGIFDLDNATVSAITRQALGGWERAGMVESVNEELPRAFVLYLEHGEQKICLSPLSSGALCGRCRTERNRARRKELNS